MRRIILITGGARSGKSTYAEKLALSLSPNPVYLATARIWDEEFRKRVIHHQERRGPEWTNIEEDKELSRHSLSGRTVLIDCITLWCTNFFFDLDADTDRSLAAAKAEFDRFTAQDATFIFVTNEIGMGGTSENEIQRKFTDMQGWMNQYVASRADEVILMVSGIATKIKCEIFRFDFIEMHDSSCEIGMGLIFRLVAKQVTQLKVWRG
jgi:adenosylcobinamide kinase/adenosylcobinamide-phosphate guanylyltransferase